MAGRGAVVLAVVLPLLDDVRPVPDDVRFPDGAPVVRAAECAARTGADALRTVSVPAPDAPPTDVGRPLPVPGSPAGSPPSSAVPACTAACAVWAAVGAGAIFAVVPAVWVLPADAPEALAAPEALFADAPPVPDALPVFAAPEAPALFAPDALPVPVFPVPILPVSPDAFFFFFLPSAEPSDAFWIIGFPPRFSSFHPWRVRCPPLCRFDLSFSQIPPLYANTSSSRRGGPRPAGAFCAPA